MSSSATFDDKLEGVESFEDSENLSAAGHGGIRAFQGSESSIFANSELDSGAVDQKETPIMQLQAALLHTSPTQPATADTLEFLEFISRNGIRIIPHEELEIPESRAAGTDAVLFQGANMKVIPGKWHTDERPYKHWSSPGSMAVALKVFKQAPVSAALRGKGGLGSALDAVRAREAAGTYTRLMRDIFYEIQIMHQAGANQHKNVAQLYGISFEAGTGDSSSDSGSTTGENDEAFVQMYLRPILVSPLAHTEYPDLRHFLDHKGDSRPRPLTWGIACSLIGDIGEGLHALHHVNVVHADLKPENILIYPSDGFDESSSTQDSNAIRIQARVADFGFSGFKNEHEMTPRGGTRVWNAPECLNGWEDVYAQLKGCSRDGAVPEEVSCVEAGEWSKKAARDIYSFGLIMVHILLDGVEPLPFKDLAELDRMKLADEVREIAIKKVRSTFAERMSKDGGRNDSHEDGWHQETLERIVKLVDTTLTVYPWTRRQSLNAIRSYLAGKYIYDRDLDITKMVVTNRFPTLASTKFSDYFHQSAASIPAIQLSFSKLSRAIKQSIFQHNLTMGIDTLTNIQKMRLLGLCTQEVRDCRAFDVKERPILSQGFEPSNNLAKPFLRMLVGVEAKLLDQYHTFRNRETHIRRTLEQFATYDASEIADNKDGAGQLGLTALHVAAMRGDVKGVEDLLKGGAQSNRKANGVLGYITPLELAVAWCLEESNVTAIIQALLPSAADITRQLSSRVGYKTTILHMAAARTSSALLRLLLSVEVAGPEVLDTRDAYYRTPLHIAAQVGSLDCVEFLLDKGANVQLRDYNYLRPHELAQKYSLEFTKDQAYRVGSDMLYDVLTYGQNLNRGTATKHEAVIRKLDTIATAAQSVAVAPEQPSDLAIFQLASQLKDYKAPVDNTKPPTFALTNNWDQIIDYFTGTETQPVPVGSGDNLLKYSYRVTATSIPRENEVLWLHDSCSGNSKRSGYLLLRARYGLRFIYHIISGLGPKGYQLVIRLGRISHKKGWNDFPVLLEVKSTQTEEIFVSQVWQTSHCLPLEDHIYTIKFADFELREVTDVEVSLSTVDIGSRSNPSALLALSWLSLEPSNLQIPHYAILKASDATKEVPSQANQSHAEIGNIVTLYRRLDEVNYDQLQETRYHEMYEEGKEWEDLDLHDMERRGLWRVKEKDERGEVQGMQIGFGRELVPAFDWTRLIG